MVIVTAQLDDLPPPSPGFEELDMQLADSQERQRTAGRPGHRASAATVRLPTGRWMPGEAQFALRALAPAGRAARSSHCRAAGRHHRG
jgi:hypothetical protein